MNITIHPSHWFHHHEEQVEHGKLYQVLHDQSFWAITLMIALILGTLVLAVVFGQNPPTHPYDMMYFP